MTPKERAERRLRGLAVDRLPNFNIVMQFAAKHAQVPYGLFVTDGVKMAQAQLRTALDFGLDILSTMSDPYRETADFGAPLDYPQDDLPVCKKLLLITAADFRLLRSFDPAQSPRMGDRVRALQWLKRECQNEYPILGWVEGALAEFCDLASVSEAFMMLLDEPEDSEAALDFINDQQLECARVQIAAGADIIGIGDASASLINPKMYRELVFPREKRLIDAIHAMGAKAKLHICGDINHILADMLDTGADIVDIDYMVDMNSAVALAGNRACICGNIHPTEILLAGTVEDVSRETRRCMREAGAYGIVSGGCEVPKFTPEENLHAVADTLAEGTAHS